MISADLQVSLTEELAAISNWWLTHTLDQEKGGFLGGIDHCNQVDREAHKGVIQNTRILWYFSEAAMFTGSAADRAAAERAYAYLCQHFLDAGYGGVLWELDSWGQMVNGRKQIYGQAFAIYAFSTYYRLSSDKRALGEAYRLFELIEEYGHDRELGGYLEAFSREWDVIEDLRLSPKDMNWPKTMNTHLHVLEAYTALYVASPSESLKQALKELIKCFERRFITGNGHLRMFMDRHWQDKSECYSYGHNIECSWLLWEALEALDDQALSDALRPRVLSMAAICLDEAIGEHSELLDAYDFVKGEMHPERVWWVQAEAMVGFLNAFELTGDRRYFRAFEGVWQFIQDYQIDREYGEWRWLSSLDSSKRFGPQKAGLWKGPYHNGRAVMEVLRRLPRLFLQRPKSPEGGAATAFADLNSVPMNRR